MARSISLSVCLSESILSSCSAGPPALNRPTKLEDPGITMELPAASRTFSPVPEIFRYVNPRCGVQPARAVNALRAVPLLHASTCFRVSSRSRALRSAWSSDLIRARPGPLCLVPLNGARAAVTGRRPDTRLVFGRPLPVTQARVITGSVCIVTVNLNGGQSSAVLVTQRDP